MLHDTKLSPTTGWIDAGDAIGRAFYQVSDKTNDYLFIGHIEINISINVLVKQKRELKNNYFEMNYFLWEKRIINYYL